ncbi:uncharacterized protein VTP21DRAFT_7471 [Calcarisporiella thermophila]|uniref:uncharacterized protein n=1 Tax=Calcarisporiella thermophila TaxID=911321 RepID=UPI003743D30F
MTVYTIIQWFISTIASLFGLVGAIKQHIFYVLIFSIYNQIGLLFAATNILLTLLGLGPVKIEWPNKDMCYDKSHPEKLPDPYCLDMVKFFPFILGFLFIFTLVTGGYCTLVVINYHRQLREQNDHAEEARSPFLTQAFSGYQAVATTEV